MAKKYDLAVKVGSYVDRSGAEKSRWQNIGVVLDGKYGPYILLNRWFNPAGVPCESDKDSITVSMFSPREQNSSGSQELPRDMDGDVPF
jgi:hypothetical protein